MKQTTLSYQVSLPRELLDYISSKEEQKHSKMGALIDLLDRVAGENRQAVDCNGVPVPLQRSQTAATVSGLAKEWNWHRSTVKNYLLALEQFGIAKVDFHSKFFIITMDYTVPGEDPGRVHILSDEEQRLNRWICGYIGIEELMGTSVQFITDTEQLYTQKTADEGTVAGKRLHKLLGHIILQKSELFPFVPEVVAAVEYLFNRCCLQDLTQFLQLLTVSGVRLLTEERDDNPFPLLSGISSEDRKRLETVTKYYASFLRPESSETAEKVPME